MRKFFTTAIVVLLGAIFVVFAVANRHLVTVSFDPFDSSDPSIKVTWPLFLVIIVTAVVGVVAGSCATWFRQGRWRRAARQHEADARRAQAQVADLRAAVAAQRTNSQSIPALPPTGSYGPAERDKQGVTL